MALGDSNYNNNDNNERKFYEPIVYSPYGVSNTEGVDPSALSFQFFRGLLKISISPMKAGAKPGDKNLWDHENAASVWLTHTKADMLAREIRAVMGNPNSIDNAGVATGVDGLISFSTGKELGATAPCIIIRKIDNNTGTVIASYAYQFRTQYHYALRNFDPNNPAGCEKYYYDNLEIDMFITLLEDYAKAIGGAQAYATLYAAKFDIQRNNTKMGLIMDKMGIEMKGNYNRNRSQGSFFDRQNGGVPSDTNPMPESNNMRSTTIDDILD